MEDNKFVDELMKALIKLKKSKLIEIILNDSLSKNEQIILFIIHDMSKYEKIPLSSIRNEINLAPSTLTPIISSLEEKELVQRYIDENDRRNIYLKISEKGINYTRKVYSKISSMLKEYIQYIGCEDAEELFKILNKTNDFINKKKGERNV